jgi:hypothetical protein
MDPKPYNLHLRWYIRVFLSNLSPYIEVQSEMIRISKEHHRLAQRMVKGAHPAEVMDPKPYTLTWYIRVSASNLIPQLRIRSEMKQTLSNLIPQL